MFHTASAARSDGSNALFAFSPLPIPAGLLVVPTLGAGLMVASVAGRFSKSRGSFVLAMGLSLAMSFLVSSQAFANYWFLIFGLGMLGLAASPTEHGPTSELTGSTTTSSPTGRSSPEP